MDAFSETTSFRVAKDVLAREIQGESVILNLKSGLYFGLSSIGTRIWQMISQEASFAEIVKTLTDEYDVDESRCRKDLQHISKDLLRSGLIEKA